MMLGNISADFLTCMQHGFLRRLLFLACVICFQTIAPARADLVQGITITNPGVDYHNEGTWSLGYQFYLTETVSLHALGYYDAGADGFLENHAVGLWTLDGVLLASANVTNASGIESWFRWESVTPINLAGDTSYVIAGFSSLDDYMWNPETFEIDPRLYLSCARYTFHTELAVPEDCYAEYLGFFGPNLLIADALDTEPPHPVPSPPVGLLVLTGAAMFMLLRRRTWARSSGRYRLFLVVVGLVSGVFFSSNAHALDATARPVQGPANWNQVPLGSRYLRYSHDNVGAILQYDQVFDSQGNYIVPVGERLRWVFLRDELELAAMEYSYVGGADHCWVASNGQQSCGTADRFLVFSRFRCRPESGTYRILVFRNGEELLQHPFDTERFKMETRPSMWNHPAEFKPKTIASRGVDNGQQKPLGFRVTDDLGCAVGLKDIEVSVQSYVVPQTNEHSHFSSEREGTGRFIAANGHPAATSVNNTRVDGKTNSTGLFAVDYKAQDYALTEKVTVKFRRPAQGDFPEQRIDGAFGWDIKAGEFVEEDMFPHEWDQNDFCHHQNQARSLREGLHQPLLDGLNSFAIHTGESLKLNDASFPWGGAVDTLDASCDSHDTHRLGIDIDVEPITQSGKNLKTNFHTLFPGMPGKRLILILNEFMSEERFGRDCNSSGIHYQYGKRTSAEECE